MQQLNGAFEVLSNPFLRAEYDTRLASDAWGAEATTGEAGNAGSPDVLPDAVLLASLNQAIPTGTAVPRDALLRSVAASLGYSAVRRALRSRLNRAIAAEVRAGRLATTPDWLEVWRPWVPRAFPYSAPSSTNSRRRRFHSELGPQDLVARVGIGSRVTLVEKYVGEGMAIPHWTLDEGAPQPQQPWRYPQE
jgi:hypothetical protein